MIPLCCLSCACENSFSVPVDFLCGSGSSAESDRGDLIWLLRRKAVDATKPSGLIPGEGTIRENPLGAIWETSTSYTHTLTHTHTHMQRFLIRAIHSFIQIYVRVVDKLSSCGDVSPAEVADYK